MVLPVIAQMAAPAAGLGTAFPEEGFWPLEQPPIAEAREALGVEIDEAYFARLARATVAIRTSRDPGGRPMAGCFVGRNGLILTTRRGFEGSTDAADEELRDLQRDGFLALRHDQESLCPEFVVALNPAAGGVETREGGEEIYDVRLVFVPPCFDAKPSGRARHALDGVLLRAWRNGKPFEPEAWLAAADGPTELGEAVVSCGFPAPTARRRSRPEEERLAGWSLPVRVELLDALSIEPPPVELIPGQMATNGETVWWTEWSGVRTRLRDEAARSAALLAGNDAISRRYVDDMRLRAGLASRPELQDEFDQLGLEFAEAATAFQAVARADAFAFVAETLSRPGPATDPVAGPAPGDLEWLPLAEWLQPVVALAESGRRQSIDLGDRVRGDLLARASAALAADASWTELLAADDPAAAIRARRGVWFESLSAGAQRAWSPEGRARWRELRRIALGERPGQDADGGPCFSIGRVVAAPPEYGCRPELVATWPGFLATVERAGGRPAARFAIGATRLGIEVPHAFATSLDGGAGNSGAPVVDARGVLLGIVTRCSSTAECYSHELPASMAMHVGSLTFVLRHAFGATRLVEELQGR